MAAACTSRHNLPPAHFVFLVTTDETALVESVTMPPSQEAFNEACRVQCRPRRKDSYSAAEEYDPTKAPTWDSSMHLAWSLCQADNGRSGAKAQSGSCLSSVWQLQTPVTATSDRVVTQVVVSFVSGTQHPVLGAIRIDCCGSRS